MTQNTKTINDIRQVGGKVRIQHIRRFLKKNPVPLNVGDEISVIEEKVTKENKVSSIEQKLGAKISPCGGVTIVEVTTPTGEKLTEKARCRDYDQFNKRLGVAIALGRIMKIIHPREKATKKNKSVDSPEKAAIDFIFQGTPVSEFVNKECTGECRTCNCHDSSDAKATHNHD